MRLRIGESAAEEPAGAINRQRFDGVREFRAAVVAAVGRTLDRLVGQHGALGFQNQARNDVFGRDQLDPVLLPAHFAAKGLGEFGIAVQAGREISVVQYRHQPNSAPRRQEPRRGRSHLKGTGVARTARKRHLHGDKLVERRAPARSILALPRRLE